MFNYHGIWRGLQTVSYDRDEYRATVKNDDRETVLVSINVLSMKNAIRESNFLASHWAEFGL